jgi:hypothetical protein
MTKYFIRHFAFLCALICSVGVYSQEITLPHAQQKFASFNRLHPQEKIFVHTDKNFYLVGELIWFKVYNNKYDTISKLCYVDVLDAGNRSVLTATISLKENEDNGSLLLPLSLTSGGYTLRAYTNWMKNTPEMSFFEKNITVINPFKNPDTGLFKHLEGYELNFFPEGGDLVKGLTSIVGVKVNDKYGKGIDCNGYVINESNEKVASFSTLKFGLGKFSFTPSEGVYKAIINLPDGKTATQVLPAFRNEGYIMTVSTAADHVTIDVKTSYTGPQNIFLYAQSQQQLRYSERKAASNGVASFSIAKDQLGKGVVQFTVFNTNHEAVCERLIFIKPAKQSTLTASSDNASYGNRKNVNLHVSTTAKNRLPVAANISVAVYPADSIQLSNNADVETYFWLTSDIKGFIESPSYYFSENTDVNEAADNLMLTQGWRRFSWNDVLAHDPVKYKYAPEIYGHNLSVKVTDPRSNEPAVGKEIFLSVPGTPFQLQTAITGKDGNATFNVKDLYGTRKMIVQVNSPDKNAYKLELESPFYEAIGKQGKNVFVVTPQQLEQYSINMQVQNIYNADSMRMFYGHSSSDTLPFYGKALYSYKLDDFTRFTTMEEVLREYVREINVVAKGNDHYLRMLDEPRHEVNENNLLVLWDGVPLQDPHSIFKYDPLKVKRLDVIPRRYAVGEAVFNGVASFVTYNGDLSGFTTDESMLSIKYEGMQLQREFYSPTYNTTERISSRMPDFRNTLYWSPNVNTSAKGTANLSFYTSDRKGKYIVVLQGLDSHGDPLTGTLNFEVK